MNNLLLFLRVLVLAIFGSACCMSDDLANKKLQVPMMLLCDLPVCDAGVSLIVPITQSKRIHISVHPTLRFP
jgi:hypothetical protein